MTEPNPREAQHFDLAPLLSPALAAPLVIPAQLLEELLEPLAEAALAAALRRAYLDVVPAPWPSGLDIHAFDAAAATCRERFESDFTRTTLAHLMQAGELAPEERERLSASLPHAAGRLARQRLGASEAPRTTQAALGGLLAAVGRPPVSSAPLPAQDGSRLQPAEWWSGVSDPTPPRRARPSDEAASFGRLASEADLGELLAGSGPDDTRLPGFAPLVELPGTAGSRLRLLPERVLHISRARRTTHTLIVGRIGAGKTTAWILPMLRSDLSDPTRTVVVIDAKGELLPAVTELTARYRPDTEVEVLNFKQPAHSLAWNPLAGIETEGQASDLAYALCHATERQRASSDSPFWINNSIDLIGGLMLALRERKGDAACLGDLLKAVSMSPRKLSEFAKQHPHIHGLQRFASFLATGSHNAETIASDARMRLRVLRDERIAAVTSEAELDVRGLGSRPRVVLLQIHEEDAGNLAPITSVFLTQLFDGLLADAREAPGQSLRGHVAIFIEEFASAMGRVPDLAKRLNTLRSRNVSVAASVQGLAQIETLYGDEAAPLLVGFSNQVYFSNITAADSEAVSKAAGHGMFIERTRTEFDDPELPQLRRSSHSERTVVAPLLLPGEVTSPPRHAALGGAATFLFTDLRPFQAFLTPSYLLRDLGAMLERARDAQALGPRRAQPLVWPARAGQSASPDVPPEGPSRELSDATSMSLADLRRRRAELLAAMGLASAAPRTRSWWRRLEQDFHGHEARLLSVLEAAWQRGATLLELQEAELATQDPSGVRTLRYLDLLLLNKRRRAQRALRDPLTGLPLRPGQRGMLESLIEPPSSAPQEPPGSHPGQGELVFPAAGSRAEQVRWWLQERSRQGWSLAETARRSGLSVGTLRYWSRRSA